ncbi:excalibur calcium-binding domain-containing protein [Protaetiibacter sp. SSC-01]|uniref:excalibur calcium-binding domain-containing protein n=1 Tax=Protaetiibacter sp. SSC-01 TaxID=2759943 RepID=UPI00223AD622|nr:excalibur calcium-binding domain-containing protein [Protaetiibacter sp. SSC-01]
MRIFLSLATALSIILAAALGGVGAESAAAETGNANSLLSSLIVKSPSTTPYDRSYFDHWIDADGDGCNTRQEKLIAASEVPPTYNPSGCTVAAGQWTSPYDGAVWTAPSDVDIDHMVPLKEAWISGAHAWTTQTRAAFANDLDWPASLQVVTDNVNQSKSDRDPAAWLPPDVAAHCRYVTDYVTVKYRWGLSVDSAERTAIQAVLAQPYGGSTCGEQPIEVPAVFPTASEPTPAPVSYTFVDVGPSFPYYSQIQWLAAQQISTGWEEPNGTRTYRPGLPVNRDAMAAFMYRLAGKPDFSAPEVSPFIDVRTDHPFYKEITWLADRGITLGYAEANGKRTWRGMDPVSRDAMALFMYRFSGSPSLALPPRSPFTDVRPDHSSYSALVWMNSNSITTGFDDGRGKRSYRGLEGVFRDSMAAFMYRLIHNPMPPTSPGDVVNCSSFSTWDEANTWYAKYFPYYGDVAKLDENNDGVVCEELIPSAPQPTDPRPANPGNSKNCTDFRTWAEADAWYRYYFPYYGDIAQLDADDDGIVCESLPGAPRR